jgi:TRAP-type C4-dicarboxylate transport system permease small subunit
MVFFVTLQVIVRACGVSLLFVDELSGYSSIWATFLGLGLAMRQGTQVRVDLVTRKIQPKTQELLTGIGDLFCVLFAVIMVIKGFKLIGNSLMSERKTALLQWPVWVLQSVMPVGFFVFALESLAHAVMSFQKMKRSAGEVKA